MKKLAFLFLTVGVLYSAASFAQPDTLLKWPLTADYTSFTFDTDTLDFVSYSKSSGITENPISSGGHWKGWPNGYIVKNRYIEIEFSPSKLSGKEKKIDIKEISFKAKSAGDFFGPRYFLLSFNKSKVNDFDSIPSDSVNVIDFPEGALTNAYQTFTFSFENPIELLNTDTIRFRIYAYQAFLGSFLFDIEDNSFYVLGNVFPQSDIPDVDNLAFNRECVSEGSLSWDLPAGFNAADDSVLVFAKKGAAIDLGVPPDYPPTDVPDGFGTPDTDLSNLPVVPANIQYENDADAMLVYNGTGTSVDLTGFTSGVNYFFTAFVVDTAGTAAQEYSNGTSTFGNAPDSLADISNARATSVVNGINVDWEFPNCGDSVLVVCKLGSTPTTVTPTGTVTDYATGVSSDYSASTSYFNGSDAAEGLVVYVGASDNFVDITGLSNATNYTLSIYNEFGETWSFGVVLSGYPDNLEVVITQERSQGGSISEPDMMEFLTLKTIDFSTAAYNLTNKSVCKSALFYSGGSNEKVTGETFFNALGTVPAGTFIRVYNSTNAPSTDTDISDGMASLNTANFILNQSGGDQVMLFTGAIHENNPCNTTDPVNGFKAAMNFGNQGWIPRSSSADPDGSFSYEPPSVSNLEMPAEGSSFPNWSLKDTKFINGNPELVHEEISDINNNWALGSSTNPPLTLKNVLLNETDVAGSGFVGASGSDLVVTLINNVTVPTDSVDIRYLVVVNSGVTGDVPADRYSCYATNLNFSLADSVVKTVTGQFVGSGSPCGTPTNGNGKVVYFGADNTAFTITDLPCGSEMFVSVYAVKGNGVTTNIGNGITESITMPSGSTTAYYSTGSGNYDDPGIWNTSDNGVGSPHSGDFTGCDSLIVQSGDTILFDNNLFIRSLSIESGARANFSNAELILTKDLLVNDSLVITDSKIIFRGLDAANIISGTGYAEFYQLEVNNTNATPGQNKLSINKNIAVTYGITVPAGNIEVVADSSVTLISRVDNRAAFLGIIPASSTVTGNFIVQRHLPLFDTDAPGGSQQGVGWRYLASPVTQSDDSPVFFTQLADDYTVTGLANSAFPTYPNNVNSNLWVFPSLQKYDETVLGNDSLGFDGDHTGASTLGTAGIRTYRDIDTATMAPGEGIFAYISPGEPDNETFDIEGKPFVGSKTINLSYTVPASNPTAQDSTWAGWHLVANPYACPILASQIFTNGGVNRIAYIWNAGGDDGSGSGSGTFVSFNFNDNGGTRQIAAGQSFWVKLDGGAGSISFLESMKQENPNAVFYKSDTQIEKSLIVKMEMVSNPKYADFTTITFNNEATFGFDNNYDGYKKYSLLSNVSGISTTIPGFLSDASINAIPELTADVEIPIKTGIRQVGEYTLSFEQSGDYILGSCLTLHDLEIDSVMQVDVNTTYTFYSELRPDNAAPRFMLSMSPPVSVESTDATCFEGNEGSAVAMGIGDGPFTYSWYDAAQNLVLAETVDGPGTIAGLSSGFYKVVIDGNNTECGSAEKEFFIGQPEAFENSISKEDPGCNASNGLINVFLDTASTWNVSWLNAETGEYGSVGGRSEYYRINSLGNGNWQVTTSNHCGPMTYDIVLDDGNDVVADFTPSADTVYISEGGEATFTNTSENASSYLWWYSADQEEPDNSFNGQYTFTAPGIYNVILWAENASGCYDIYQQEIVVMQTTGINDLSREYGLIRSYIAYNNGNPQYVIELDQSKMVNVELRNTMGQLLYSEQVMVNGETRIDLPANRLSSGMYMVITLADGTRIDTQKLFVR